LRCARTAHLDRKRGAGSLAVQRNASGVGAEAHELRVGAGPRRKTLRGDVQRLQKIRLAGAVVADDQDESAIEAQLQARVRAEMPKRDRADDQP